MVSFRVSRQEIDDLYRYARARRATMSYMIREALCQQYPDIFKSLNRHIRKPKKNPLAIQERTQVLHSLATGIITVMPPENPLNTPETEHDQYD